MPSPFNLRASLNSKSYITSSLKRNKELNIYDETKKKNSGGGIIFLDRDETSKRPETNKSSKFERKQTIVSFGVQQTPQSKFSAVRSPFSLKEGEAKFKDIAPSMIKR